MSGSTTRPTISSCTGHLFQTPGDIGKGQLQALQISVPQFCIINRERTLSRSVRVGKSFARGAAVMHTQRDYSPVLEFHCQKCRSCSSGWLPCTSVFPAPHSKLLTPLLPSDFASWQTSAPTHTPLSPPQPFCIFIATRLSAPISSPCQHQSPCLSVIGRTAPLSLISTFHSSFLRKESRKSGNFSCWLKVSRFLLCLDWVVPKVDKIFSGFGQQILRHLF